MSKVCFFPVEALLSNSDGQSPSFQGDPGRHHISPHFGGQKPTSKTNKMPNVIEKNSSVVMIYDNRMSMNV